MKDVVQWSGTALLLYWAQTIQLTNLVNTRPNWLSLGWSTTGTSFGFGLHLPHHYVYIFFSSSNCSSDIDMHLKTTKATNSPTKMSSLLLTLSPPSPLQSIRRKTLLIPPSGSPECDIERLQSVFIPDCTCCTIQGCTSDDRLKGSRTGSWLSYTPSHIEFEEKIEKSEAMAHMTTSGKLDKESSNMPLGANEELWLMVQSEITKLGKPNRAGSSLLSSRMSSSITLGTSTWCRTSKLIRYFNLRVAWAEYSVATTA